MEKVCLIQREVKEYTKMEWNGRPSVRYPEVPFEELSPKKNEIYDMVREGLHFLGFDEEHYGTSEWNPLKDIIHPGDCVLLKPNLVLDINPSGCGTDCVYTQPELVAAMIDYVYIALAGSGKIVVGDAPLQECVFEKLIQQSGYDKMIAYYKSKEVDIELVDFRNVKTFVKDNLHYLQENEHSDGIVVRLDENSSFAEFNDEKLSRMRITNYDPRILKKHHSGGKHEYNVAKYVLEADVIINMPKPKTHRKAGVTIALKNLVGINANKEFLPHHTLGGKEEGGDAYLNTNVYLEMANIVLDIKNQLVHDQKMECASAADQLYIKLREMGKQQVNEAYWEGSWYGNDTIWRTIHDLNKILLYADKKGVIQKEKQRQLFIVADMIVSGQKEGPLEPTPKYPGVVAMGKDPLIFDRVICSLMGFDYKYIPTLYNDLLDTSDLCISDSDEYSIISNNSLWKQKSMDYIRENASLEFEPTLGWIKKLGNRYRDRIISELKRYNKPIYIWGACKGGIYAAEVLHAEGIQIKGFIDNAEKSWNKEVCFNVKCFEPKVLSKGDRVIVATKDRYVEDISTQINAKGAVMMGIINEG